MAARLGLVHQALLDAMVSATRYSGGQEGAPLNDREDEEQNRLSARAARYVRVGTNVGAVAARVASQRLFGLDPTTARTRRRWRRRWAASRGRS